MGHFPPSMAYGNRFLVKAEYAIAEIWQSAKVCSHVGYGCCVLPLSWYGYAKA